MEDQVNKLKEYYKIVFESDHGKIVMQDLEKRCHYNATTNVRGDSHESAYME
jgi:acyl-CoA-binding protein